MTDRSVLMRSLAGAAVCAGAETGSSAPAKAGSSATVESRARRSMPEEGTIGFMLVSFELRRNAANCWAADS